MHFYAIKDLDGPGTELLIEASSKYKAFRAYRSLFPDCGRLTCVGRESAKDVLSEDPELAPHD